MCQLSSRIDAPERCSFCVRADKGRNSCAQMAAWRLRFEAGMEETIGASLGTVPHELGVLLMAMVPMTESRGAIAWGMAYWHMPLYWALWWSILGNTLCVLPLMLWIDPLRRRLTRVPLLGRLIEHSLRHAERHKQKVEKYGPVSLVLLGCIPVPGSGPYTLVMITYALGLPRLRSLLAIEVAMLISGIIVALLTAGGMRLPHLL